TQGDLKLHDVYASMPEYVFSPTHRRRHPLPSRLRSGGTSTPPDAHGNSVPGAAYARDTARDGGLPRGYRGITGKPPGAPACAASLVRDERRADSHQAFLSLRCALMC